MQEGRRWHFINMTTSDVYVLLVSYEKKIDSTKQRLLACKRFLIAMFGIRMADSIEPDTL